MVTVRTVEPEDIGFLWEMLYRASWSHLDPEATLQSIRNDPDLAYYVEDWGRPGDIGVVAHDGPHRLGAAWVRNPLEAQQHSYAYVADDVPELAVAVTAGHEGRGIGTVLLDSLLHQLPDTSIVLTARSTNPAIALYQRHGFVIVDNITNRVGTTSVKMLRNPDR